MNEKAPRQKFGFTLTQMNQQIEIGMLHNVVNSWLNS